MLLHQFFCCAEKDLKIHTRQICIWKREEKKGALPQFHNISEGPHIHDFKECFHGLKYLGDPAKSKGRGNKPHHLFSTSSSNR